MVWWKILEIDLINIDKYGIGCKEFDKNVKKFDPGFESVSVAIDFIYIFYKFWSF